LEVACRVDAYASVGLLCVELSFESFDVFVGGVECVACLLEFVFEFLALCECISEVLLVGLCEFEVFFGFCACILVLLCERVVVLFFECFVELS